MSKKTDGGTATPKTAASKKQQPAKSLPASSAASSFNPLAWIGGLLEGTISFLGLGPTNPFSSAPRDFVRLKSEDLLHAVEADAEEAYTQGKNYLEHIKRVIETRNRLKANAIQDARHAIGRWEALAEQAATRIELQPKDKQEAASAKEMLALITQVETEFRAMVPGDILQMAADISKIIAGGEGSAESLKSLVEGITSSSKSKRRKAMAMAGASDELVQEMDSPGAVAGVPATT